MNSLFGEFGLLDVLVVLNYLESKKANKTLKKMLLIQLYAQFECDSNLDNILKEIKDWKARKL